MLSTASLPELAAPVSPACHHRNRSRDISFLRPPAHEIRTHLADQCKRGAQPVPVGRKVEPAVLTGRMRQRNHYRPLAERLADALLERTWAEEARDRQLAYEDQHLRPEQAQLTVEPVGAVGDARGRRPQVAAVLPVPPGKAAHQRGDVRQVPELFAVP